MPVITINGQPGSGGREVGQQAARLLGIDFVDQQILVEAAQRLGTPLETLPEREFYALTFSDRLGRLIQRALRSSSLASGADFSADVEVFLARPYSEAARSLAGPEQEVSDAKFVDVTRSVMREVAQHGNVVILGRGANVLLRDIPGCIHVGFVAPLETRVRTMMERKGLGWEETKRRVDEETQDRAVYYHKFFRLEPDDPTMYDVIFNMHHMDRAAAAALVVQLAKHTRS
ncbi:MAG: cytidylate kinase-like family protein [Dehalococcoidia bacterium]|nr:cytidylate kinase-like family protein [Dehalococcoidia bacterium]